MSELNPNGANGAHGADGAPELPEQPPFARQVIQMRIEDEMRVSYTRYAMSVIVGRALPDARDGLKPVHRRILYAMYDQNMLPDRRREKCASAVGEVLKKYHPHGDQSVYDALVRMAQDFSMRYPLVDGQGNFGCFTGDTKIKLLDGTEKSFEQLARLPKGESFAVYSVNCNGEIVVGKGHSSRITRRDAELIELTFDDGATVKCTPDHRFMLRDGSYKEAQYLTIDDSLMAGYFESVPLKEGLKDYLRVLQPKTGEWQWVHHLADQFNLQNGLAPKMEGFFVRHHRNFDRFDNRPENIERMRWNAHTKIHVDHLATLRQQPEFEAARVAGIRRYWAENPDVVERIRQRSIALHKTAAYRAKYAPDHPRRMALALWENPQMREIHRKKIELQWQDPVFREAHLKGREKDWARRQSENPDCMTEMAQTAAESLTKLWATEDYGARVMRTKIAGYTAKLLATHGREQITPEFYDAQRDANWIPCSDKAIGYFENFEDLLDTAATHNHRVVATQWLEETADVYDITVDEHHNFLLDCGCFAHNSVDGDSPAAYRYTEARMAPIAAELLRDIDSDTVDFGPNFSETTTEPTVFPAVYPNLLVNGSAGIAVGMATNIPPHNLGEVCDAVALLIDNPNASVDDLLTVIPGPDFPTAGLILGKKGIRSAFETGRGSVIMQARATIEPMEGGRHAIIVTEIPYQVNKATLIQNIAQLARDKKIDGLTDVRDESDRTGMRMVIEMRRDANPNVVLNFLYKHTALRTSFGVNTLALVEQQPKMLPLRRALEVFIGHREEVIVRRSKFQLAKAEARSHILEGFRAILASIDDVIALIRSSQSRDDARQKLINEGVPAYVDGAVNPNGEMVLLSEIQANAVLDMRLGQLTQLDRMKIDDEFADLQKDIERLRGIIENPARVRQLIKQDMARIKKDYGNPRRTQIIDREAQDLKPEDLIAEEDVVVTITRDGYIKKLPKDTYNVQNRGGRGKVGLTKKEEDQVEHLFVCTTHNILLVFTNKGTVYQLKTYEIPTASRQGKGTSIRNLLQTETGEVVTAVLNISEFSDDRYLFMVTREGTVKKTPLTDYSTRLQKGIIAIKLQGKDELRFVFQTDGKKEIILASRQGMSVHFKETDVAPKGRVTQGMIGMKFKDKKDYVVGAIAADEEELVLTVSELGLGKRSKAKDYRLTKRGGLGVITLKVTEKTGELVALKSVDEDDELMIISKNGIIIRSRVDNIRETGRVAQGVKLINLDEGDMVAAVAKIIQDPEGDEDVTGESAEEAEEKQGQLALGT